MDTNIIKMKVLISCTPRFIVNIKLSCFQHNSLSQPGELLSAYRIIVADD